jgi:hypothetical protein
LSAQLILDGYRTPELPRPLCHFPDKCMHFQGEGGGVVCLPRGY